MKEERKVIRKKGDVFFLLLDEAIEIIGGIKFKNSYWLECDEKGNISDGNKDGIVQNQTVLCRIPNGKEDIDLSTLSENCLE